MVFDSLHFELFTADCFIRVEKSFFAENFAFLAKFWEISLFMFRENFAKSLENTEENVREISHETME